MKILMYDNPINHRVSAFSSWNTVFEGFDCEKATSKTLGEALDFLRREHPEVVLIHHFAFSEVDEMREVFPGAEYFGYSGINSRKPVPGSVGDAFSQMMIDHYDRLIFSGDTPWDLLESLDGLSER